MKIQYVSDLHLDFGKVKTINKIADVLVIAGDISNGGAWLNHIERLTSEFDKVFIVLGNHEHYSINGKTLREQVDYYKKAVEALDVTNIELLDNEYRIYKGKVIYGGTMWTRLNKTEGRQISRLMNDFNFVTVKDTVVDNAYFHAGLQSAYHKFGTVDLVISHHAPSFRSVHPKFAGSEANLGYVCRTAEAFLDCTRFWIHGHMHDPVDYIVGSTRVVANPRGYTNWKGQLENADYIDTKYIDIS